MPRSSSLLKKLQSDEPDYDELAASITPEAINELMNLVEKGEPLMASKATYLASLIRSPRRMSVITAAANRDEAIVRVAAAAAIGNGEVPDFALGVDEADIVASPSDTLERLLHDPDPGVRKRAKRSESKLRNATATAEELTI